MSKAPGERLDGRDRGLYACGQDRASGHAHGGDDGDGRGHLGRENDLDDDGGDDSRARLYLDNAAPREPRPARRSSRPRLHPARD